jgi:hypothetical protein
MCGGMPCSGEDKEESGEAPRSRQQTNSAVVPLVALLQKDGTPFDVEMMRKNTELPRRDG